MWGSRPKADAHGWMDGVLSDTTEKVHAARGLRTQRIKMKRKARGIVSSQTKGPFKASAAFCVLAGW